ncbi:YigZ family protein [Sulfuricurvum sp.]|uniref:IMPACT family protein n=1 Tax=Sulfuricurvum sp. TaxID=2025608 RepID=UPI00261D34B2|nr:YigZ family protein [Sulfuricurvum sp.]MDD2780102.1 YigZ family protein [Sulfuricurvum sp.]
MVTVNVISSDTIEIKGSKFIAFLMPMSMYNEQMTLLRALHPKAVHWVSAYRYLNEFDQIVEHSGDDGEPKGTSGKPTLSVLQGHDLINAAIITVRYFGGTKLGPGGLVRAYAEAANAAYAQAELLPYEKLIIEKIECNYSNVSMVEYESTQKNIRILSKEFGEKGAIFEIEGTGENSEAFFTVLGRSIQKL